MSFAWRFFNQRRKPLAESIKKRIKEEKLDVINVQSAFRVVRNDNEMELIKVFFFLQLVCAVGDENLVPLGANVVGKFYLERTRSPWQPRRTDRLIAREMGKTWGGLRSCARVGWLMASIENKIVFQEGFGAETFHIFFLRNLLAKEP